MKIYIKTLCFLIISMGALAQSNPVKQRLTATAESFISVYNSGDSAVYKQFLAQVTPDSSKLKNLLQGYKNAWNIIGKVGVRKINAVADNKVEIWVQCTANDSWWKFYVLTDSMQHFQRRMIEPVGFTEEFLQSGKRLSKNDLNQAIDHYVQDKLGKDFTGNVFIANKSGVLYSKSFGNNLEGKPNTQEQLFELASMGKIFTAISILQLRDLGKLELNDNVAKHVPELKNAALADITISQLLTHTSGMGDYFESPLYSKFEDSLQSSTAFMPFFEADKPAFAPGTNWQYSNTGFALLGLIIEKASGKSFKDYVNTSIFLPTGMNNTISSTNGSGGGKSTVTDLYHFSIALLNNKLLSKNTTAELLNYTVNGKYGYGTEHQKLGEEYIVGHSGGFINACTELNIYTKNQDVVIILSNSAPPFGHFLSNKIKELLVRKKGRI